MRVYEAKYWGELLNGEVEGRGEIREHPTAMGEAVELGHRCVAEEWAERR